VVIETIDVLMSNSLFIVVVRFNAKFPDQIHHLRVYLWNSTPPSIFRTYAIVEKCEIYKFFFSFVVGYDCYLTSYCRTCSYILDKNMLTSNKPECKAQINWDRVDTEPGIKRDPVKTET
jgi:hypothetical protein